MNELDFDRLARALAVPASRRVALAAILGGVIASVAPAAKAGRCGRKRVRCNGRCVKKKRLPCCPDRDCSIMANCVRTNCPPGGVIKNVKLSVENRSGNAFTVEFWHKDANGCHNDRSLTLNNNESTEYASGALNALAWINGRFGIEGDNPPIGTPFVNMVHDGTMTTGSCYTLGTLDLQLHSLVEGEGVHRTIEGFTFEMFRLGDTDDDKVFRLTVRKA